MYDDIFGAFRDVEPRECPPLESGTSLQRDGRLDPTEERIDQLSIICAAMWELLREKTGLTEADLVERIAIIDARDGQADGKMSTPPRKCPKCHRTVFPKHQRCLYCGADTPADSVFKTV